MRPAETANDRGFSLVEVVFALLVFQIGVLGTMTLTVAALDTLRSAEDLERAVSAMRLVADSLLTGPISRSGDVAVGRVTIRWRSAGGATVAVDAEALVSGRVRARMRLPVESFMDPPP